MVPSPLSTYPTHLRTVIATLALLIAGMSTAQSTVPAPPCEVDSEARALLDALGPRPDSAVVFARLGRLAEGQLLRGDSAGASLTVLELARRYLSLGRLGQYPAAAERALGLLPARARPEVAFRIYDQQAYLAVFLRDAAAGWRWVAALDSLGLGAVPCYAARVEVARAKVYEREGKYAESLASAQAALQLAYQSTVPADRAEAYASLLHGYKRLNDLERQAAWVDSLEAFVGWSGDSTQVVILQQARASIAFDGGDLAGALALLDVARSAARRHQQYYLSLNLQRRRGSYLVMSERYSEGLAVFAEVVETSERFGIDPSHALYWIGVCHRGLNDYPTAAAYIERAYDEARQRNLYGPAAFFAHANYQTYLWRDRHKPALEWFERYAALNDSVASVAQRTDIEVIRARERLVQEEADTQRARAEAAESQARVRFLVAICVVLVGGVLLGGYAFRQNRSAQRARAAEAEARAAESEARAAEAEAREAEAQAREELLDAQLADTKSTVRTQALTLARKAALSEELRDDLAAARAARAARRGSGSDGSGGTDTDGGTLARLRRKLEGDPTEDPEWATYMQTLAALQREELDALASAHPGLTQNDLRLCALIGLRMSNKEVARALSVSEAGVKKARYRLRKRLDLATGDSLDEYVVRALRKGE